jgi:hypothetical protein
MVSLSKSRRPPIEADIDSSLRSFLLCIYDVYIQLNVDVIPVNINQSLARSVYSYRRTLSLL